MTVEDLRSFLLALPGHLPVALRTSDPSQGIIILGSLEKLTVTVGEAPGLLLEAGLSSDPEASLPVPSRRLHALPSPAKEPAP